MKRKHSLEEQLSLVEGFFTSAIKSIPDFSVSPVVKYPINSDSSVNYKEIKKQVMREYDNLKAQLSPNLWSSLEKRSSYLMRALSMMENTEGDADEEDIDEDEEDDKDEDEEDDEKDEVDDDKNGRDFNKNSEKENGHGKCEIKRDKKDLKNGPKGTHTDILNYKNSKQTLAQEVDRNEETESANDDDDYNALMDEMACQLDEEQDEEIRVNVLGEKKSELHIKNQNTSSKLDTEPRDRNNKLCSLDKRESIKLDKNTKCLKRQIDSHDDAIQNNVGEPMNKKLLGWEEGEGRENERRDLKSRLKKIIEEKRAKRNLREKKTKGRKKKNESKDSKVKNVKDDTNNNIVDEEGSMNDASGMDKEDIGLNIQYSKFTFDGESNGKQKRFKEVPTGRNYAAIIEKVQKQKEKAKGLEGKQAEEFEEKLKFKKALARCEGMKVKDNEEILKKSLAKKKMRKMKSEDEWRKRKKRESAEKEKKQKKRTENIKKRAEDKKKKKMKKRMK